MQDGKPFSTERPKPQRVYVVARDPNTGKSRSATVYGVSPEQFIGEIVARGQQRQARRGRRSA